VPSEQYLDQAGVRIRYRRIEGILREHGHELRLLVMSKLRAADLTADVYLISKCYDARAVLLARRLAASAIPVGVDLFDDYFSQAGDSRFAKLRYWLERLLESTDFVLCSTSAMRELAARICPAVPVHVMNDPGPAIDAEGLRLALLRNLQYTDRTGIVNVAWFGIGDNPHFAVGLADLAAYGGALVKMRDAGLEVRLQILTNQRAMTADGLAMLRRLPVPYTIEEWAEEREQVLLTRSLVCFLPVNAQSFSAAKSLNRAISALCAGTQVLSPGYPLYDCLAPFIYREPSRLLADFKKRALALREQTIPDLLRLVGQWADARTEAGALATFLARQWVRKSATRRAATTQPPAAVIHSREVDSEVHKFAQRIQTLSVASPLSVGTLNFDLRFPFSARGDGCDVLIAEKHCATLNPDVRALVSPHGEILKTKYYKLDLPRALPGFAFTGAALGRLNSIASTGSALAQLGAGIEQVLRRLYPGIACYVAGETPTVTRP
jgi:hypothetical protein